MNKESINFYHKNGYIILSDILSPDIVTKLVNTTNRIAMDENTQKQFNHLYDFENSHDKNNLKVLRRIQTPELIDPLYREVGQNSELLAHLSDLLGQNIRLEGIKINFKSAKCGSEVLWHQDWAYQPYTNDNVLTIGILLDECHENNSPIYVIPESHKGPTYRHDRLGVFSGAIDLTQDYIPTHEAKPLLGKVGDITVHHYRALHYSPKNISNQPRKMLFIRYASADAWPLMGVLDYKDGFSFEIMKSRIVLGEQTLEPKLKEVPVRMPLPYPSSFSKLNPGLRSYGILESFSSEK